MKSYYIIIRGALGVGKTTIAKELAKILNAKIFHIDEALEEIKLDSIDEKLGCIPVKNFLKVNKTIVPQIKNVLDLGKVVIIDGCFYHKEQLDELISSLSGYKGYIFTLKSNLKTCIRRDSERKRGFGKNATESVYKLVSRFDCGIIIGSERRSIKQVTNEILEKLR